MFVDEEFKRIDAFNSGIDQSGIKGLDLIKLDSCYNLKIESK